MNYEYDIETIEAALRIQNLAWLVIHSPDYPARTPTHEPKTTANPVQVDSEGRPAVDMDGKEVSK